MPKVTSSQTELLRKIVANRIRVLRANRKVWAPGAPRADRRCRRGPSQVNVATLHSPCTVADLVEACEDAGFTDLYDVTVRAQQVRVPHEEHTADVLVLSAAARLSDEDFAEQIASLWNLYQCALNAAAGRLADYQAFLKLKAVFEPK